MTIHLMVDVIQRRLLFMMFHVHQVSMTTEFTLVVDSSNWKSGKFVIIAVQTSYSLTDDSYLSLRHPSAISVTRIALPQQILFYTRNVFIYVCLYLFVPFVILLILPILVYVCTLPNLMVVQQEQSLWLRIFRNCFIMLSHSFHDVIPFFFQVHFWSLCIVMTYSFQFMYLLCVLRQRLCLSVWVTVVLLRLVLYLVWWTNSNADQVFYLDLILI